MSLKHGILGLLNYDRMTGYELDKAFRDSLGFFWQAQTSQIYRELKAMEKLGWLTSEVEVQTGRPNKILYSITDAGRRELLLWLNDNDAIEEPTIRSEFLMKLFFSGEKGIVENIVTLKEFRAACESGLDSLTKTRTGFDEYENGGVKAVYWSLTARFGESYMKMCLDFADEAMDILKDYYVRARK